MRSGPLFLLFACLAQELCAQGDVERVHGRHILIAAGDQVARQQARQQMQAIKTQLQRGVSFEALARTYSQDPASAARGGDLGWFGRGQMVRAFEEAAFGAQLGQIVGPIETEYGLHLIQIIERMPPAPGQAPREQGGFIDEFDGASLGQTAGIRYVPTPTGQGAAFSRSRESRVEYGLGSNIPREGTLEWRLFVESGYSYDDGRLTLNKPDALVFTTTGPDTWYPGSAWVSVSHDGTVSFSMADSFGGQTPLRTLTARDTGFRFGAWHVVGISYGSMGRAISVDGRVVARDALTMPLAAGGDLRQPRDLPTLGEMVSRFGWSNNRHDAGFEGVVDVFRASPRQQDWRLVRRAPPAGRN